MRIASTRRTALALLCACLAALVPTGSRAAAGVGAVEARVGAIRSGPAVAAVGILAPRTLAPGLSNPAFSLDPGARLPALSGSVPAAASAAKPGAPAPSAVLERATPPDAVAGAGVIRFRAAAKPARSGASAESGAAGPAPLARSLAAFGALDVRRLPPEALGGAGRRLWDGEEDSRRGTVWAAPVRLAPAFGDRAAIDVPRSALSYRRLSPWRAFAKHSFERWKGKKVFEAPLVATDHPVLAALSYAAFAPMLVSALLQPSTAPGQSLLAAGCLLLLGGTGLAANHFKESADGFAVTRNARRYAQAPSEALWDEALADVVRKFQASTGWEISWTDDPQLLAKAEPAERRVILSVGWVLRSDEARDRRRLAYLTHTLRAIRQAIESRR